MSLLKTFKSFQSPKRFSFVDPDTAHPYEASSKGRLIQLITNYREQNELPPITALSAVLDNYWCGLPENVGKCTGGPMRRGWFQTLRGGIALLENVAYRKIVAQDVAEQRAQICKDCVANIFPDKTSFIKWADELAEASTDGRRVSIQEELGSCEICSCNLRAKVWYGGNIKLTEGEKMQMMAANPQCWQLPQEDQNVSK